MKFTPGDVFEIKTNNGFAFIQYILNYDKPPYYGSLVRILDGIVSERPNDITDIVAKKELFYEYVPLKFRNQQKLLNYVGNYPIPPEFQNPPIFRVAGMWDRNTGIVEDWGLQVDGKDTDLGQQPLPEKYYDIPTLGTWNIQMISTALDRGYLPKYDIDIHGKDKGINLS